MIEIICPTGVFQNKLAAANVIAEHSTYMHTPDTQLVYHCNKQLGIWNKYPCYVYTRQPSNGYIMSNACKPNGLIIIKGDVVELPNKNNKFCLIVPENVEIDELKKILYRKIGEETVFNLIVKINMITYATCLYATCLYEYVNDVSIIKRKILSFKTKDYDYITELITLRQEELQKIIQSNTGKKIRKYYEIAFNKKEEAFDNILSKKILTLINESNPDCSERGIKKINSIPNLVIDTKQQEHDKEINDLKQEITELKNSAIENEHKNNSLMREVNILRQLEDFHKNKINKLNNKLESYKNGINQLLRISRQSNGHQ